MNLQGIRWIYLGMVILVSMLLCFRPGGFLQYRIFFENKFHKYICSYNETSYINTTDAPSSASAQKSNLTDRFPFNYIFPATNICQTSTGTKPFLMIVVCSAVNNCAERQVIRETWGSTAYRNGNTGSVRLAFLVGTSEDQNSTKLVQEESRKNLDIIQLDFHDSYKNLTYKTMAMLKWVKENCPDVPYLLKSDDDMYVNVPNLISIAKRAKIKKNVMFGVLLRKREPLRDNTSKWFVSLSRWPDKLFPDYLFGGAYVMSGDTIPILYETSLTEPYLFLEDVYVSGICGSKAGIRRLNCRGFTELKRPSTGCIFRYVVTGHHVTIPEMKKIFRDLENQNLKC